jgi:hypothetical protein
VVQEDTREVLSVVPMDLRAERVDILHLSVHIHPLGGFLDLYIHKSRGDSNWDNQGRQEDSQDRGRKCHKTHLGSTRETI